MAVVGAYLVVKPTIKQVPVQAKTCSNEKCVNHTRRMRDGFCSTCGSPIKENTIQVDKELNLMSFTSKYPEFEDVFYSPEFVHGQNGEFLIMDNQTDKTAIHLSEDEFKIIIPDKIGEHLAEFLNRHEEGMKLLKEYFGPENIKLVWGVVNN